MEASKQLYQFLKRWYKPTRFEGRNQFFSTYSSDIAKSYAQELKERGKATITQHESVTNYEIIFNTKLEIINAGDPIKETKPSRGRLANIFGG